ncbi:hypothetical protein GBAR_LOCUS9560, partial [Geodia barretti]
MYSPDGVPGHSEQWVQSPCLLCIQISVLSTSPGKGMSSVIDAVMCIFLQLRQQQPCPCHW